MFKALSIRSGASNRTDRVYREDKYTLSYFGRHRHVTRSVVQDKLEFIRETTSVSACFSNSIARSQWIMQVLANLDGVNSALTELLKEAGRIVREGGQLYDHEFPVRLREWINANCGTSPPGDKDLPDDLADPTQIVANLSVVIVQLIGLRGALEENNY